MDTSGELFPVWTFPSQIKQQAGLISRRLLVFDVCHVNPQVTSCEQSGGDPRRACGRSQTREQGSNPPAFKAQMCRCVSRCDRIKRAQSVIQHKLLIDVNEFMWQRCSLFWDYDIYTHNHQQRVGRGAKTRVHFRYFYLICVSFHQKREE